MSFFQQIGLGLRTHFKAIGFMFTSGLWWFFIFPILVTMLLFFGGTFLVDMAADALTTLTNDALGLTEADAANDKWYSGWASETIGWLYKILLLGLKLVILALVGGFLTLMLLAPALAFLSEKAEEKLTGVRYPFNIELLIRDAWRGILIATRNMFIQLGWAGVLFIIGFIPIIGLLAPVALFLISAYFYGFSFMDYYNERRRYKISQSVKVVRQNKWLAITNGAVFSGVIMLQSLAYLLGGFIAWFIVGIFSGVMVGCAALTSTVAATMALNEVDKKTAERAAVPQPVPPAESTPLDYPEHRAQVPTQAAPQQPNNLPPQAPESTG